MAARARAALVRRLVLKAGKPETHNLARRCAAQRLPLTLANPARGLVLHPPPFHYTCDSFIQPFFSFLQTYAQLPSRPPSLPPSQFLSSIPAAHLFTVFPTHPCFPPSVHTFFPPSPPFLLSHFPLCLLDSGFGLSNLRFSDSPLDCQFVCTTDQSQQLCEAVRRRPALYRGSCASTRIHTRAVLKISRNL